MLQSLVTSKTQETARSIIDEVGNSFQFGGADGVTSPATASYSGFSISAQCIGNFRYTYIINSRVTADNDASARTSRHALWVDIINEGAACVPLDLTQNIPQDASSSTSPDAVSQRRELVPQDMRLDDFSFNQPFR